MYTKKQRIVNCFFKIQRYIFYLWVLWVHYTTTVIFYTTGIDVCSGKKFPTTKNKKLIDICSKCGYSCEFQIKTISEMCKSITQSCQKQGASISKAACERLLQLCLNNSVLVNNEINKLCSFVNGGEITIEITSAAIPAAAVLQFCPIPLISLFWLW